MIIVNITGGLGNQMFQYALARSVAVRNDVKFTLNTLFYKNDKLRKYGLDIFAIQKQYAKSSDIPFYEKIYFSNKYIHYMYTFFVKGFLKRLNPKHVFEKKFTFDSNILLTKKAYLDGNFQTEKYFLDIQDIIRNDFTFVSEPSLKNKEFLKIINACESVSIHVRRGDYVSSKFINKSHGTCSLDYYKKSIKYIESKVKNPVFFLFSDDIDWVKEHLKISHTCYYIDWNVGDQSFEDMRLMTHCKYNIIANSTFSWWGAWLNSYSNKIVIAPQKWFNAVGDYSDVIPESWIKI